MLNHVQLKLYHVICQLHLNFIKRIKVLRKIKPLQIFTYTWTFKLDHLKIDILNQGHERQFHEKKKLMMKM